MTGDHLPRARENAQRTYDRRRARTAAEQLAVIPPNRWDDRTRQIIATLATISAPSRIDDLLDEVFEPPIGGSAENTHDMPSPYSCAGELAGICSGGPAHHPECPDVDARVAGCRPSCGAPACVDCTTAGIPGVYPPCGEQQNPRPDPYPQPRPRPDPDPRPRPEPHPRPQRAARAR